MIKLTTNHGVITLDLNAEKAPKTVANFNRLRRGRPLRRHHLPPRDQGLHDPGRRHGARHEPEALTSAPIENEAANGLKNKRGSIAMARTNDPHSATAQFFINTVDNDFLDFKAPSGQGWGYCVFGEVVEGMDVVDKIRAVRHRQQGLPSGRAGRRRDHRESRDRLIFFISDLHLSPRSPGATAFVPPLSCRPRPPGRGTVHPRRPLRSLDRRRRHRRPVQRPGHRRAACRQRCRAEASASCTAIAISCWARLCRRDRRLPAARPYDLSTS
jgi:peptidyl-prolyl cis-trans isomerase B (cyclophilin B)